MCANVGKTLGDSRDMSEFMIRNSINFLGYLSTRKLLVLAIMYTIRAHEETCIVKKSERLISVH